VTVTGEIEGEQRSPQSESDRVKGVRVLRPTVNQNQLGLAEAPAKAAELAKTIDRDEKSLDRRDLNIEVPLVDVLVKK
jgi:hypothetical protein